MGERENHRTDLIHIPLFRDDKFVICNRFKHTLGRSVTAFAPYVFPYFNKFPLIFARAHTQSVSFESTRGSAVGSSKNDSPNHGCCTRCTFVFETNWLGFRNPISVDNPIKQCKTTRRASNFNLWKSAECHFKFGE